MLWRIFPSGLLCARTIQFPHPGLGFPMYTTRPFATAKTGSARSEFCPPMPLISSPLWLPPRLGLGELNGWALYV